MGLFVWLALIALALMLVALLRRQVGLEIDRGAFSRADDKRSGPPTRRPTPRPAVAHG